MIQQFADWLIYDLCGIDATTQIGEAFNFFVYDTLKIIILLFAISIVMGIVNAYFPTEGCATSSHQGSSMACSICLLHYLELSPPSVPVQAYRCSSDLSREVSPWA